MKSGLARTVALAFALALFANASARAEWLDDYSAAMSLAKKQGRPVLIDFMGSDWCVPCIQMKKKVFGTDTFKKYAAGNLVLLEVDFPQETQLPEKQYEENLALGKKYGAVDSMDTLLVPTVTLIDSDGKVLASQNGAFFKPEEVIAWVEAAVKKMPSGN
jgi:thiol-disulfide isomerase/thioredoxin